TRPGGLEGQRAGKGERVGAPTTGGEYQRAFGKVLQGATYRNAYRGHRRIRPHAKPLPPRGTRHALRGTGRYRAEQSRSGRTPGRATGQAWFASGGASMARGPMTLFIHRAGSLISSCVGSVSGDRHTWLNPLIPTSVTTRRTKREPSAYCFIFRSMPRRRRIVLSSLEPPSRRPWKRERICLTDGTTSGPTASIT